MIRTEMSKDNQKTTPQTNGTGTAETVTVRLIGIFFGYYGQEMFTYQMTEASPFNSELLLSKSG
jgi:hypothetical protein